MKLKVLTNSDSDFELASRSARTVKALRLLQIRSAYYSDKDRYGIIKEQCLTGWIKKEEETEGMVSFEIEAPELGADAFRDEVAKLLFPDADIENNLENIDYEIVEEGLQVFLNFIEPRHKQQIDISTLLRASRNVQTANTGPETATEGP